MRASSILDCLEASVSEECVPISLKHLIERELIGTGIPQIRASEIAEERQSSVLLAIEKRIGEANKRGVAYPIVILDSRSSVVAGFSHVLPHDSEAVARAKQNRLHVRLLHSAVRALNFSEFELFSARVLSELGASHARVTPHSNDQGIDFVGLLSLDRYQPMGSPFVQLARDIQLTFAGQAKHYPNRAIGPDTVRELLGAISLARTKTFSDDKIRLFEDLGMKPFSPLVAFLFTSGDVSAGAIRLASEAGMIVRSGEQLCVFLADRGVGMTEAQPPSFDHGIFRRWLIDA